MTKIKYLLKFIDENGIKPVTTRVGEKMKYTHSLTNVWSLEAFLGFANYYFSSEHVFVAITIK